VTAPTEQIEQIKQSKFVCSACGSGRDCDCAAPALERLAEIREQTRQRTKATRERKREEDQQSRSATPDDAATSAEARKAAYAEDEALPVTTRTEEWMTPIEGKNGKWVILYRTVFGTFDSEETAERWAMTHYPDARRWAQEQEASEPAPADDLGIPDSLKRT
jgi:hypothetical protein